MDLTRDILTFLNSSIIGENIDSSNLNSGACIEIVGGVWFENKLSATGLSGIAAVSYHDGVIKAHSPIELNLVMAVGYAMKCRFTLPIAMAEALLLMVTVVDIEVVDGVRFVYLEIKENFILGGNGNGWAEFELYVENSSKIKEYLDR
jgi:hypothetical protein